MRHRDRERELKERERDQYMRKTDGKKTEVNERYSATEGVSSYKRV